MTARLRRFLLAVETWMEDESMLLFLIKGMFVFGIGIAIVLVPIAGLVNYYNRRNPHILLNRSDWQCTHTHVVMQTILVGKMVMTQPIDVCDTYRMRGYENE